MSGELSNYEKGKFLEKIVLEMYKMEGIEVKKNVYLEPIGRSGSKREIDILVKNKLAGKDVNIAIECKNVKKRIDSPKIDSSIGKLNDVGIPTQLGIFISAGGFTNGAIERARKEGITTLVFEEITEENLKNVIKKAFQSILYLVSLALYC